jgi:NAD(P)-dependent dehydrogenase (short-subunit alcohol dehydrogenase family)
VTGSCATPVAVVTGAARGIGARIADRFEEAGYFVYRADVVQGAPLPMDVADRASVRAAFGRIGAERGGLDVLVNNAGLLATGPFEQMSGEAWDRLLAVNLTGVFNCVTAALTLLRGRPGASIINIASVSAEKGGGAMGNVWYGATKAGVVAMTRGLARELGPSGIRVNAISPSVIDTYMVREHLTPEVRERVLTRFPLGRLATEDDVAGVALFLASPAAAFVTGEAVTVDGGFLRT